MSSSGAAEFAKRFRVKNITVDLSPVSLRQLLKEIFLVLVLNRWEREEKFFSLIENTFPAPYIRVYQLLVSILLISITKPRIWIYIVTASTAAFAFLA